MTPVQILILEAVVTVFCVWLISRGITVKRQNYCDSIKEIRDIVYGRVER